MKWGEAERNPRYRTGKAYKFLKRLLVERRTYGHFGMRSQVEVGTTLPDHVPEEGWHLAQGGGKLAALRSTAGWTVGCVRVELECSAEDVFEKRVEGAHLAGYVLLLLIKCKRKETGDASASKKHQDDQQSAEPRKKQARPSPGAFRENVALWSSCFWTLGVTRNQVVLFQARVWGNLQEQG